MGPLWAFIKLLPKLGGFLMTSRTVLEIIKNKASDADGTREFATRVEKLEAAVAGLEDRVKKLTTALYLIAGIAIAALVLSVVKLA